MGVTLCCFLRNLHISEPEKWNYHWSHTIAVPVLCLLATGTVTKNPLLKIPSVSLIQHWSITLHFNFFSNFLHSNSISVAWFCSYSDAPARRVALDDLPASGTASAFNERVYWRFDTIFVGFTSASSDCEHFQPHTCAFAFIPQATTQATCYEHLLHYLSPANAPSPVVAFSSSCSQSERKSEFQTNIKAQLSACCNSLWERGCFLTT